MCVLQMWSCVRRSAVTIKKIYVGVCAIVFVHRIESNPFEKPEFFFKKNYVGKTNYPLTELNAF